MKNRRLTPQREVNPQKGEGELPPKGKRRGTQKGRRGPPLGEDSPHGEEPPKGEGREEPKAVQSGQKWSRAKERSGQKRAEGSCGTPHRPHMT